MVDRRQGGSTDTVRTSASWRWSCSASAATNGRAAASWPSGCGSSRRRSTTTSPPRRTSCHLTDEFSPARWTKSCWPWGRSAAGRPGQPAGSCCPLKRRAARWPAGGLVGSWTPTGPGCADARRDGVQTGRLDELAGLLTSGRYEPVRATSTPPPLLRRPPVHDGAVHTGGQPTGSAPPTPRCPPSRSPGNSPPTDKPASRPMPRVWWLLAVSACSGRVLVGAVLVRARGRSGWSWKEVGRAGSGRRTRCGRLPRSCSSGMTVATEIARPPGVRCGTRIEAVAGPVGPVVAVDLLGAWAGVPMNDCRAVRLDDAARGCSSRFDSASSRTSGPAHRVPLVPHPPPVIETFSGFRVDLGQRPSGS